MINWPTLKFGPVNLWSVGERKPTMTVEISYDTADAIAVQVLKNLVQENPDLRPHVSAIFDQILPHSELQEWKNGNDID